MTSNGDHAGRATSSPPIEVRRIGSVQQTLTEMGRGERFVIGYLRARARERERWYVGLPLAAVAFFGIAAIAWAARRPK